MKMSELFKCSHCKCECLEEVMSDVTVASVIEDLDEWGDAQYGEQVNEGGEIVRFQCLDCGEAVKNIDGSLVQTTYELYNLLLSSNSPYKPN